MSNYTVSLHYDRRLYRQDIAGSIAHARMLAKQGIITQKDAELIVMGLTSIREEIEKGQFPWKEELEDIHMNIESSLAERIGPVAGKLHTGRSRNDQIALDMRMYTRDASRETIEGIRGLQRALLGQAETNRDVAMPGYTHLQRAQPVLFAHHLLAYSEMLERDRARFRDCYHSANVLPLGSGALAGVPYPIDRESVARELGFTSISGNSMDAVSDRDFLVDFHASAATCIMHLSRLGEELALWSAPEFGYVTMSPDFATGSSIMPQKHNPDFAELARAKTGRVYGHLMAILTVMKGLPLTYNRDLQEDKEGLFDTVDTLQATLQALKGVVSTMEVNAECMARAASDSYLLATDIADYLVRKGLPFREAHGVVKELCAFGQSRGLQLGDIGIEDYRRFSPLFGEDVYQITIETSLAARDVPGGTAPRQVGLALTEARRRVEEKDDFGPATS